MLRVASSNDNKISPIWKLYHVINPMRSSCKYCSSIIATKSGNTSGLRKHMERYHPGIIEQTMSKASDSSQKKSSSLELLSMAIATSSIPFRFVENRYFRMFMKNEGIKENFTGEVIKKELERIARNGRIELFEFLRDSENLCITFDGWSARNCKFHVYSIFLVRINESFEREIVLVGAPRLEGRATADNISKLIVKTLENVGIKLSQINTGVTDSGSNVVKSCKDMGLRHIPCVCHQLSLFFRKVFENDQLTAIMDKARQVATFLSKSTTAREKFAALSVALGETTTIPKNHCVTRWAGAYLLLKSYIESHKVIQNNSDTIHLAPTPDELTLGNVCIEILEDANLTITKLEGDTSTASSVIANIMALSTHFKTNEHSHTRIGVLIEELFENRFGNMLDNTNLLRTTFIDPRYAFYDKIMTVAHWEIVKLDFQSFYDVFYKKSTNISASSSSSVTNALLNKKEQKKTAMQKFMCPKVASSESSSLQTEISNYQLLLVSSRPDDSSDPVGFWKEQQRSYPILSEIARELLAIPSSSAATERLFSRASHLVSNAKRNKLKASTLDTILQVTSREGLLKENSKIYKNVEDDILDSDFMSTDEEDYGILKYTSGLERSPDQIQSNISTTKATSSTPMATRNSVSTPQNKPKSTRGRRKRRIIESDSE